MNYFLVGGAGFIGSHCLARLAVGRVEPDHRFDNFCTGRPLARRAVSDNIPACPICEGDAKDLPQLREAMQGHDAVYHFAANADIAKAVSDPSIDFWEGTYLTQNVLEAMRLTGCRRIIYISGSGVYGDLGEEPVVENRLTMLPVSPYGASKLGFRIADRRLRATFSSSRRSSSASPTWLGRIRRTAWATISSAVC